jgi:DNA-binding phage protein
MDARLSSGQLAGALRSAARAHRYLQKILEKEREHFLNDERKKIERGFRT